MRRSAALFVSALAALLWGTSSPLAAQGDAGTLIVLVRAADTGQPLVGAQVVARGLGIHGATDASGVLRLTGLRPGSQMLEARFLGYAPQSARMAVEAGRVARLTLELPVRPIELAAVKVNARASVLLRNGFYDRRDGGFGTFITREEIDRMRPRFLSDVLRRVAGVTLHPTRMGGTSRASMRGNQVTSNCPIQYYVDGTMAGFFNIDEVMPQDVEGLEIYRGAATIPPAYNKGTALCGVVLIWTRVQ